MSGTTLLQSTFAVIAAVVAAVVGLWLWLDFAPDLTTRLRDDAYYEFVWAANVAAGHGPTVSDGVTTSGVQWLWSLLLVPVAWLAGPAALPVAAPWLGLTIHCATAVMWSRIPRSRLAALCLSLCWLGHPLLLREAQNGQETALCALLATLLIAARRWRERDFTIVAVLAVLARTDLLALVVCLSLWRHRKAPPRAIAAPAIAFTVLAIGNLLVGGGLLQDSAAPMAWLWHENLAATGDALRSWWWYARPAMLGGPFALASKFGWGFAVFLLVRPWWPKALRVVPAVVVGAASALGGHDLSTPGWAALLLALFPANSRRRVALGLLAMVAGLSAIVVVHWAIRWYPRDYYVVPLVAGAFAVIARYGRWRLLLACFAIVQVEDMWRIVPEPLAGQREMELAGRFVAEVLPPGERVGCFNSGIVTFHADVLADGRNPIVNLDGVVDARSFRALREHRMAQHLDELGVRFVLDNPVQFSLDPALPHACGRFFGSDFDPATDLVEVARFDVPGVHGSLPLGDSMRLYRLAGRGASPPPLVRPGAMRWLPGHEPTDAEPLLLWGARAGDVLVHVAADGRRQQVAAAEADTVVLLDLTARRWAHGSYVIEGL